MNIRIKLRSIFFGLIFSHLTIAGDIETTQVDSKEIQKEGVILPADLVKAMS